jgi:hypothetical protein
VTKCECDGGYGTHYDIATRKTDTILRAWLDEVLPHTFILPRPVDDFDVIWPQVEIWPMSAWGGSGNQDPDWLTDSRVLGRWHEFRARTGDEGLADLIRIRHELERELKEIRIYNPEGP